MEKFYAQHLTMFAAPDSASRHVVAVAAGCDLPAGALGYVAQLVSPTATPRVRAGALTQIEQRLPGSARRFLAA